MSLVTRARFFTKTKLYLPLVLAHRNQWSLQYIFGIDFENSAQLIKGKRFFQYVLCAKTFVRVIKSLLGD